MELIKVFITNMNQNILKADEYESNFEGIIPNLQRLYNISNQKTKEKCCLVL